MIKKTGKIQQREWKKIVDGWWSIAEIIVIEKFDNVKILNDTDDKFPNNIAFKNKNSLSLLQSLIKPKKILLFPQMWMTRKTFTRTAAIFF